MSRALCLVGTAAVMLCVTVGICYMVQEDPSSMKTSGREMSGRLAGLDAVAAAPAPQVPVVQEAGSAAPVSGSLAPAASAVVSEKPGGDAPARAEVPAPAPREEPVKPAVQEPAKPAPELSAPLAPADKEPAASAPAGTVKEESSAQKESAVPEAAPAEVHKKEAAAEPAPASAREKKAQAEEPFVREVTSAKFVMQGSLIKLVLRGNASMVGHYSVLKEPDRVVLDLAGNWKIEVPRVPSNRLIKAVRVGHHDDMTRLVFDMKTTGKVALVPLNRNALELRIR